MAVILRRAASTATFYSGYSKAIPAWLGYLPPSNKRPILVHVLRQYKTTSKKQNKSGSPLDPQIYYRIYKPDNLPTQNTKSQKEILLDSELEILSKENNNPNRHDLQSKLETLEAFGCTMDQIQESPEILQLSLTEIVKRASSVKKLGHENISVQLLKIIRPNMSRSQLQQKIKSLEPMMNYSSMSKYMQGVLNCSHAEMHTIMQKVPGLKSLRNMAAFSEKVEYLRSEGFTTEDLKAHPGILCRSVEVLKRRTTIIKKFQEVNEFPIPSLIVSEKQFQKFINKYHADQETLKGHQDRNECIAKMFGVSEMIESQMHYFYNRRLATVKPRIEYLMSVGIPLEDIRNHPYILRYKKETLEKAFVKSQEAGIENISVLHLIHIIICGRVPLKPPSPKSTSYIPQLLGISQKELKKKFIHLRPILTANRLSLKENLDFLLSEGFTVEQVCTCPLILSNKLEDLKNSLQTLPQRPEMRNNQDLLKDGTMKINLMQYFLEKESNFRLTSAEIL